MAKIGSFDVVKKTLATVEDQAVKPREPDTFDFCGQEFRILDETPSLLPLMEFADAISAADEDSISMPALGAMYQMLRNCIDPRDWESFRNTAMRARAAAEDLLPITMAVWEAVSSRPTRGPSGSPDGPSTTSTGSKAVSPSRTDRPSSFRADLPGGDSATVGGPAPDLSGKLAANEWPTAPDSLAALRPDLAAYDQLLTPVDDLIDA
jgi:hypothetical protein